MRFSKAQRNIILNLHLITIQKKSEGKFKDILEKYLCVVKYLSPQKMKIIQNLSLCYLITF